MMRVVLANGEKSMGSYHAPTYISGENEGWVGFVFSVTRETNPVKRTKNRNPDLAEPLPELVPWGVQFNKGPDSMRTAPRTD